MNESIIAAIVIGIVFFGFKFLQMRLYKNDGNDMKKLFRETLLVSISVFLGNFVISQFSTLVETIEKVPNVFTNDPDF